MEPKGEGSHQRLSRARFLDLFAGRLAQASPYGPLDAVEFCVRFSVLAVLKIIFNFLLGPGGPGGGSGLPFS